MLSLLLDENLTGGVATQLRTTGFDDFSDIHRFPLGTHRGIVVLRLPNDATITQLVAAITSRLSPLTIDDTAGNLFIVTPRLMRVRLHRPPD